MNELVNNYASFIKAKLQALKNPSANTEEVAPFVTISRQTGAYGITISKGLCECLMKQDRKSKQPWAVFDEGLLKKVREEYKLAETALPYLPKDKVKQIQDISNEIFHYHPTENALVKESVKTILHLAQLGHVILVGRASNVITAKLAGGIHIRLVSSFDKRVEHIEEFYPMLAKEAKEYIYVEDATRKDYLERFFGKNIEDPLLYDAIINVDRLEPKEVIQIIAQIVTKVKKNKRKVS